MRKLAERILLFVLGSLSAIGVLFLSFPCEIPPEPINKWYKISTDEAVTGEVVILDMSRGYAYSGSGYILLVVKDSESDDEIVVAFPDGGYWTAPTVDSFSNFDKYTPRGSVEWKKD